MNNVSKTLFISVIVNIFIAILKILGGIFGYSKTLLADGIHSLSDLGTDILGIIGGKMSSKPADEEHPYGHEILENVVSLIMGIIIVFIGIMLFKNSFDKKEEIPSLICLVITFVSILFKYLCSSYIMKKGIKFNSPILVSNAKESRMDVLSSVFVFIVIIFSQFSDKFSFLKYIDIFGCLVISMIIVFVGVKIIYKETNDLIGKKEYDDVLEEDIKNIVNDEKSIVTNSSFVRFGNKYLLIIKLNLCGNLSLKDAVKIKKEKELLLKEKFNNILLIIDIDVKEE